MNFADGLRGAQALVVGAAKAANFPMVAGFANFVLGQGTLLAQFGDLLQKIQDGTAQDHDYADVAKATGDIFLGLGILTGAVSNPIGEWAWFTTGTALGQRHQWTDESHPFLDFVNGQIDK